MSDGRPTLPIGDAVRKLKLPGWLRWLLELVRGTRIHAGPVDIQLNEGQGATPPRTGLDQAHQPGPPVVRR